MLECEIFFSNLLDILLLFAAGLILVVPAMSRRDLFPVRLTVSLIAICTLSAIYLLIYALCDNYRPEALQVIPAVWQFLAAILTGVLLCGCFKMHFTDMLWSQITAYAVQHGVYAITYELVFPQVTYGHADFWPVFGIYLAVGAVAYILFWLNYHFFGANFNFDSGVHKARFIFVFVLVFVTFIGSTFVNRVSVMLQDSFSWLSGIADLITCIIVVTLQLVMLRFAKMSGDKMLEDGMLAAEKKQYQAFKSSVDYLNVKVHDLKHELARMQKDTQADPGRLQEVADNIAVYESFAKTGNDDLDLVLTQKNLMCLSDNITLTYLAEADKLSAMRAEDIYSLFGNMLDNAIECERKMPEGGRFIRLFIKPSGSMLIIHCENHFEGNIKFKDGLPVTTKENSTAHGFGTRSMQMTAKRYGGKLKMNVEDNLFKTEVILCL